MFLMRRMSNGQTHAGKLETVKEALEAAGKTDTFYYQRALAILAGKKDLL